MTLRLSAIFPESCGSHDLVGPDSYDSSFGRNLIPSTMDRFSPVHHGRFASYINDVTLSTRLASPGLLLLYNKLLTCGCVKPENIHQVIKSEFDQSLPGQEEFCSLTSLHFPIYLSTLIVAIGIPPISRLVSFGRLSL